MWMVILLVDDDDAISLWVDVYTVIVRRENGSDRSYIVWMLAMN